MIKNFIIILTFISLLLGCSDKEAAFSSSVDLSDVTIDVELVRSHLFLAEYERFVNINKGQRLSLGKDSGGHEFVNIYKLSNQLIFQSWSPKILLFSVSEGTHRYDARSLTIDEANNYIGKFHFIKRGVFGYSSKKIDPVFSSKVMKGG